MFTVDGIKKFHAWTHASLDRLVDHLSTIPADDYGKELAGFGFPTLREQAIHIFNCEGFWIHTLQGRRYVDRTAGNCASIADLRLFDKEVIERTHAYLLHVDDQLLNAEAELRFSDDDVAVRTPALVMHHVLTHAFHHKGQIVAMCRMLGHPAPGTDLNYFA